MHTVGKPLPKIDAAALTTGCGVYTEDQAPPNCLVVRVLRSPHAHALIKSIRKDAALKVAGIECILTHEDAPPIRFTFAGQSYPEPSPYDRYILENRVRYVGDPVAIVAGRDESAVAKALKMLKVTYEPLPAVLDFEHALDHPFVVHPEPDYHNNFPIGGDASRNLLSSADSGEGDVEEALNACDIVIDRAYHTLANQQAMMETFRTYTYLDHNRRLCVVSSTQIPFHVRRIVAHALGLSPAAVRVIKPRIGGGFGAKQSMVSELFPALVTMKTGKPAKIIFTRQESFSASNSRHEMKLRVRMGADKNGVVKALHLTVLSNVGAYGEHASTTVGLAGSKTIALYAHLNAWRFDSTCVYTNTMPGGAFRGYGATQGCFAVESAANELAARLGLDPVELRLRNIPAPGAEIRPYQDGPLSSSRLEECIRRGAALFDWQQKWKPDPPLPPAQMARPKSGTVTGVGMAITMQGSGIAGIDTCSATLGLDDNGGYTLLIGATDMGTGCDTILAQMAAEVLDCPLERITVDGVDTDHSPFDKGSYASSTTYVTGGAVVKAAKALREKIRLEGAKRLQIPPEQAEFDGNAVYALPKKPLPNASPENASPILTLEALAQQLVVGDGAWLTATATHSSPVSPPPLMAGFAEVEVDLGTGAVRVTDYVGVVDCGTVINPNLATVQTQGGIAQGIGMALYEDVRIDPRGRMRTDSFLQYKIPSRLDLPPLRVAFEESNEPSGPFGAKSIGEIVINTPCPAIAAAVANAVGVRVRTLPITPEKILLESGVLS